MKLSSLQQSYTNRRNNSFRGSPPLDAAADGTVKSPAAVFWLVLHCLCCLISLILGFRFSRLVFFLLFSTSSTTTTHHIYTTLPFRKGFNVAETVVTDTVSSSDVQLSVSRSVVPSSRVVVGRHGILIRPWPHPNPEEVMKAHKIIDRVQREQMIQYGVKNPTTVIVITPTYVRTFQALHLTGVMHTLMNVPYDLVWIVVEAGGVTNETASLLAKSGLRIMHTGFKEKMPVYWNDRHRLESRMRLHGLRIVREEKLDGIVMFADDSNMHSMDLFDEIQKVKWFGALSVGILVHSGHSDDELSAFQKRGDENKSPLPVQGPACNSSDQLIGWHTLNSTLYVGKTARFIGDRETVLPRKLEWAGFVLNSQLLWNEAEDKPDWVNDLDIFSGKTEDIESPLSLLKDPSVVEPLGSCGRKVLLWWLRVEARADSKFPSGWTIDPQLEITVPARRTPWPDLPAELPSNTEKVMTTTIIKENTEKHAPKTRASRSRRSSRSKRKREAKTLDSHISVSRSAEIEKTP